MLFTAKHRNARIQLHRRFVATTRRLEDPASARPHSAHGRCNVRMPGHSDIADKGARTARPTASARGSRQRPAAQHTFAKPIVQSPNSERSAANEINLVT